MTSPWRIQLLGGLRAERVGDVVTRFRTKKTASLLAFLAFHLGEAQSRDTLVDQIWPEFALDAARNNLSVSLNSLRKQLEPPEVPRGSILHASRTEVALLPAGAEVDVCRFAELTGGPSDVRRLAEAEELYRGPLAMELLEDWAARERDRLAEAYTRALGDLTRHHSAAKEFDVAMRYAQLAVSADPLRESAHRTVIRLHLALGKPSEAVRRYREMEELLRRELRAEPSERARALFAEIPEGARAHWEGEAPAEPPSDHRRRAKDEALALRQAQRPPREGEAPAGPPSDRGRRTKENALALRQAQRPPREGEAPAEPPGARIPLQFTRFFGRQPEIETLRELLNPERPRSEPLLVTITGPGGNGKTRLGIEVAGALREAYKSRIWFVPLADLRDAEHLPAAVSRSLGLPLLARQDPLDAITALLGDKPCLLILDNLEQLGEAGAQSVQRIRARLPRAALLTTSRRPLDLPGEIEATLGPLPLANTEGDLIEASRAPSVALFVDRARSRVLDFQLTPSLWATVAGLCARLEGSPLAIELAAARIRSLNPRQMLEAIEERFRLLETTERDRPERHRSLWAAIDWSYRLLDPGLQQLFASLSVFRGGWTAHDAAAVCMEGRLEEATEVLGRLRAHSLITFDSLAERPRYRLMDSLREYAREQLSSSAASELRERHFAQYLQRAEVAREDFDGGRTLLRIAEHDDELGNLRSALEWGLSRRDARVYRLAASLARYWERSGRAMEGVEWLRRVEGDVAPGCRSDMARAMIALGTLEIATGSFAAAESRLREVCSDIGPDGDPTVLCTALLQLAAAYDGRSRYAESEEAYERALEAAKRSDDPLAKAHGKTGLGNIRLVRAELQQAKRLYLEALADFEEHGLPGTAAKVFNNLGIIARDEQRYDEALHLFRRALEMTEIVPNPMGRCTILNSIGLILTYQGRHDEASAPLEDSLRTARQIGYPFGAALALRNIGLLRSLSGDLEGSREALSECLDIRRRLEDHRGISSVLSGFSNLAFLGGRHENAVTLIAAARTLRERCQVTLDKPSIAEEDEQLRKCLELLGEQVYRSAWAQGEALSLDNVARMA